MNDPTFLAQAGHTLAGILLVFGACVFAGLARWPEAFGTLVLWATVKEFWYDARYELPKQTLKDNLLDWLFYMIGGVLGVIASFEAHHLGRIR
jgi:uncharacterized membrane protein YphA (DoxX/SURF4 family)